jgi:hypothetical protein
MRQRDKDNGGATARVCLEKIFLMGGNLAVYTF